ncbi:MAG: LptF/LptG family permease [Bacteriovorax sp.]|jgi:lipopolysaccharide export system permease protein
MLKVTTRYLASTFIPPFVLGFVFFVAFLITFYMFRIINLIVNKGVDLMTVLSMVVNLSVSFFPLAAPLAAFFATIYSLNKLSEDSEIIAMRSFGITKFNIYKPFLIVSLLVSLTVSSLYSVFIPKANAAFKNTIVKLTSAGMLTSIKSGQFFTDIPNATLFAEHVSEEGNNFREVFLHVIDKNKTEQKIIFANTGSLIKIYADQWHAPSLRLHLSEGNIIKMDAQGQQVEKILFKEYDFPVFSSDAAMTMLNKDSMKTNDELTELIDKRMVEYDEAVKAKSAPDELRKQKTSFYKTKIELYSRYVTIPQIMLFVFLGFSLGIKRGRGGGDHNSAHAFIYLLSYYIMYFFLISLAQKAKLEPAIATFVPSVILLFVAIRFYKKLDWVG